WYPRAGDFLAVTAFGKYLKNPLNETTIASSTNDISTINTGDFGFALGAEFEARLQLAEWDGASGRRQGLIWAGNLTYMHSEQELSKDKVLRETEFALNLTRDRAPFTGASKYLANTDISYAYEGRGRLTLTGTVQLNYTS